jgi:hypothetical protein
MEDRMNDGVVMMDEYGVSLSEALALLRSELQEAMKASEGDRLRFAVDSVELELEMATSVTRGADGRVSLWKVVSAGGKRDSESSARHRLTLVMKPRDTSIDPAQETLVGDDMP